MTATNHAVTGALIGVVIGNPLLALPLALLSHFICDSLPHYGAGAGSESSKRFRNILLIDISGCFLGVLGLALVQPQNWQLAAFCAFLATSPDFMWVNKFRRAQRGDLSTPPPSLLMRFHARIQWFERPIGIWFEAAWLVAILILLKVYSA